jgi:hypothetical protein
MVLVDHPHIVPHYTWWKEKFVKVGEIVEENMIKYFLIMKYAENGNLWEDLKDKKYKPEVRFLFNEISQRNI